MAELKNHPGFWLRDDAAAQFDLLEDHHGLFSVNSAARTVAEQRELIRRWDAGGVYNRPPYLYEPKRPAEASTHVYDGGIAVDTSSITKMLKYGEAYGFYQRYSWDRPHFEFDPRRVKIRPVTPKPSTPTTGSDDDMPIAILERKNSQLTKCLYDVDQGRAIRPISVSENTAFRKASTKGSVVYITVSDAEYRQRGGV